MRHLIDRFPLTSFIAAAGASKAAALSTVNALLDAAYTALGCVFLALSIVVILRKQFIRKPVKIKTTDHE